MGDFLQTVWTNFWLVLGCLAVGAIGGAGVMNKYHRDMAKKGQ